MKWIRFFWSYISYRKDLMVAILACAIVMAGAELSIPWFIMNAIDQVLDGGGIDLDTWVLSMLGILAALYLAHVVLLRVEAKMILHSSYNLRRKLYTHIHSQALPFFRRHRTGELMHRVTSDTKIFEDESAPLISDLPGEILILVGVTTMMMLLNMKLALLVIVFMFLAAAVAGYLGQPLPSIRKSAQRLAARLTARLQETVAGVRTVQGFNNVEYELARVDEQNREILQVELKEGRVFALMEPLGDLMELLGLVLVVWFGGHLIIANEITTGALVAFIAYMEILARPLGQGEAYFRNIQASRAVGERLQEFLEDQEMLSTANRARAPTGDWSIEAQCLSFRHAESERNTLNDVTFTIRPGETVAVAGPNGAGKSTLMDLLMRFYDPTAGHIVVGGVNLRDWDLGRWRQSIGILSQDVFLFHGTIRENIAYGRPEATPEEIEQAVRDSWVHQVIQKFPEGLDTIVGERGTQLSGGERQCIALARLFLRKPKILILDEPTTHLDGEALQRGASALKRLMSGRTSFLVTHSPETIRLADRVLYLEQGELIATGTHQALIAKYPGYRALWGSATEAGEIHVRSGKRLSVSHVSVPKTG